MHIIKMHLRFLAVTLVNGLVFTHPEPNNVAVLTKSVMKAHLQNLLWHKKVDPNSCNHPDFVFSILSPFL